MQPFTLGKGIPRRAKSHIALGLVFCRSRRLVQISANYSSLTNAAQVIMHANLGAIEWIGRWIGFHSQVKPGKINTSMPNGLLTRTSEPHLRHIRYGINCPRCYLRSALSAITDEVGGRSFRPFATTGRCDTACLGPKRRSGDRAGSGCIADNHATGTYTL